MTKVGDRAVVEICQLYVNARYSSVTTPSKQLREDQRVALAPGQTQTVTFALKCADLWLIDVELRKVVEPGEFDIMVGPSSREADLLKAALTITA